MPDTSLSTDAKRSAGNLSHSGSTRFCSSQPSQPTAKGYRQRMLAVCLVSFVFAATGAWAAPQLDANEWYAMLQVATSDGKYKDTAVVGQLNDSSASLDTHDLLELPAFYAPGAGTTPYTNVGPHGEVYGCSSYSSPWQHATPPCVPWLTLAITVPDPNSRWRSIELDSEFRSLPGESEEKWYFEVKGDNRYRSLILSWSLVQHSGQQMSLRDLDFRRTIPVTASSYSFNMSGLSKRRFAWIAATGNP